MRAAAFSGLVLSLSLGLPAAAWSQTIESTSSSRPHPGIRVVEGRTSGPAADFYAAYVSLCNDYVHVDASEYGGASTSGGWATSVGAELAVNGDFFTYSPRAHVYGDAVGGGSRWPLNRTGLHGDYSGDWYHERHGWIAFGDDWVDFTHTEWIKNNFETFEARSGWKPREVAPDPPPGTKALVSGFPQLVVDGDPIECSSPTASDCFPDRSDMRDRHPRTAMGLSRDRQTLLLVVVDGRSTRSAGMYGAELAKLMHDLGAHTAFNLDGGGSSQMWVRGSGTINDPSDGSPRSVLNHWGVFAGSGNGLSSLPGHCDNRWDGLVHVPAGQLARTTDLDGDGRGDVCARTAAGIECSLFRDGGFGAPFAGPELADGSGWGDPSNYATFRWGDVNGDGRADLCARANAGVRCYPSTGDGFGPAITGPALNDASGFDRPRYYTTLRLLDLDGDGRDDLCARWGDGIRCYASTGDGFAEAIAGPALADDSGWADVSNYGTLRTGDIDGDGRADLCARANAGIRCWRSEGDGFATAVAGPAWSDADGFDAFRYWSTLRLADLDGDGRADLCIRAPSGLKCHLSRGDSFGPVLDGPAISDEMGWADYSNYATLRLADVTGDGMLDACARANAGMRCWPFDGAGFGGGIAGPLDDGSGWSAERFHRTIDFVDLDADGRADLCARADRGIVCFRSLGDGFEETVITGPAWSGDAGFDAARYYGTVAFLGRARPAPEDSGGGGSDGGATDGGAWTGGADSGTDGLDGGGRPGRGDGGAGGEGLGSGGCGCTAADAPVRSALALLTVAGLLLLRRRRRAR